MKNLLDYYDDKTILYLLKIADKYRKLRKSRITKQWFKWCKVKEQYKDEYKLTTNVYHSEHPLGCIRIPYVTSKFIWSVATLIGDGTAIVCKHRKKKIDMFVVRLKVRDYDLAKNVKDALREAGLRATFWKQRSSNFYICRIYNLLLFSIIKAIRENSRVAVGRLIIPLIQEREHKLALLRGFADSEGYISIHKNNHKNNNGSRSIDIYVVTNKDRYILRLVSNLLHILDYPHTITKKTENCNGIRLRIRNNPEIVLRFSKEIGFTIKRKQNKLKKCIQYICRVHQITPNPSFNFY